MKRLKSIITRLYGYIPSFLKNYYLATLLVFTVWMAFFDSNNFISLYKANGELNALIRQKKYYQEEISKNNLEVLRLTKDPAYIEKFGRENYLMKRKGEDIFLIIEETAGK